jgi:hypothetical protein
MKIVLWALSLLMLSWHSSFASPSAELGSISQDPGMFILALANLVNSISIYRYDKIVFFNYTIYNYAFIELTENHKKF